MGYYHLVFSLPHSLVPLVWQNKKLLFTLLFETAAATLLEVAADPKHLGAEIGFLSILHTWGQTLQLHPHLHCVVPGGGLSPDHQRWISSRPPLLLAGESAQPGFSWEVRRRITPRGGERATGFSRRMSSPG